MTKRFTFGAVSPNIAMIKDDGKAMNIGEVVDKLNELAKENEQLKEENKYLKRRIKVISDELYCIL